MADKEDIITQTLDKDVVGMQTTFAELMLDKIRDAVAERKAQVAQEFMGVNSDDEESEDDDTEEETEDYEESEEEEFEDDDLEVGDELDFDFEEEDLEGDSDENA
jgi:hypothetical protein